MYMCKSAPLCISLPLICACFFFYLKVEEIREYISLISQKNKEICQVHKLITSKPATAVLGVVMTDVYTCVKLCPFYCL